MTKSLFATKMQAVIRIQKLEMPGAGEEPEGSSFIFERVKMPKKFLTYQQQMQKLENSGLTIVDKVACERVLSDIGYFPVVNGYQEFFRDPSTRIYREGSTFEDILALYKFDDRLREIMLDALLKVETKLRSVIAYEFCSSHGESQQKYLDVLNYSNSKDAKRIAPKLIGILDFIANQDTSHQYLVHYRNSYGNVPLWVAVNAMTFGQTSKMLIALKDSERSRVAKRFGAVTSRELSQFVRVLALYRNVCAHGERLFSYRCHVEIPNTVLHAKFGIEKTGSNYACGKVDVFAAVIALRYLLPSNEFKLFKGKLTRCINEYLSLDESIGEERLFKAMGFPAEWKKITRYKI